MNLRTLDWNALRYVLALARRGSLERAAAELGVDPSTVSRRVHALEFGVGARVFDRAVSGHRLTPVGLRILQTAEQVELKVAAMERDAHRADERLEGKIRIATLDAIASRLAPFLARFRRDHPLVDFEIVSEAGPASLVRHAADLALSFTRPAQVHLASRRIASLGFALYAAREYLEEHPVRPDDPTRGHQLLGYHESLAHLPDAEWLDSRALGACFALRASSVDALLVAAASGLGLAVLPCWIADADPRLVRLLGPDPLVTRDLWMVVHRESRRAARLRAFTEFLMSELRERATNQAPEVALATG
jgi:DNA-binding transcriptional LysR family regulator